jgi:uncharacterized protein (UPF0335 family)
LTGSKVGSHSRQATRPLEDEIKDLSEAKKEIYLEAKSNGFDVRIIREVIRLRKQDPKERDELESLIEEYWQAIKQAPPPGQKAAPAGKAGEPVVVKLLAPAEEVSGAADAM